MSRVVDLGTKRRQSAAWLIKTLGALNIRPFLQMSGVPQTRTKPIGAKEQSLPGLLDNSD